MAKLKASGNDRFFAVMKKTGGRCYYCGVKKWPIQGVQKLQITIDHITPTVLGGTNEIENLVPCCRECNSAKCAGTVEELRHHAALRSAQMPKFSREQIAWIKKAGADISKYEAFKFWFEVAQFPAHKTAV